MIRLLVVKFVHEVGLHNSAKRFMCAHTCAGFGKIHSDPDGLIDKFLFWVIGAHDG